jgi:hypothetical protein
MSVALGCRYASLAACLVVMASGCGSSQPAAPAGTTVALVQVENSADSDPHAGLQAADVVYEYAAEGGISRFTVVYFDPARVSRIEPVRSIRPVSLKIRESYGGAIFFAGGSQPLMSLVQSQMRLRCPSRTTEMCTSTATTRVSLPTTSSHRGPISILR